MIDIKEKISKIRYPSETCVICNRALVELGGLRIVRQYLRGICLSDKYLGIGNKDYPHQSFKLSDDPVLYMVVWGPKELWTQEIIKRAKNEFFNGRHPWFCQICAERQCSECGMPINFPAGSDIIYDDGNTSHVPILAVNFGCSSPECSKYRKL